MALVFGVTDTTETYVIGNSTERSSTAEIAEARDQDGKVTDEKAYSLTHTATINGVLVSGGSTPDAIAGTSVTIDGQAGLATTASVSKTNTGYATGSITVQKKDSSTQVAYS